MKKKRSKVIVTTSRGVRCECLPIAVMLDGLQEEELAKLMAEREVPPPVTYTFADLVGVEVTREHDATSIADPKTPDEEREAWERRRSLLAEIESLAAGRAAERSMRIISTQGVLVLDMPPEKKWIAEHKWLGYDVPDDPLERVYHYFVKKVVGTKDDLFDLMVGIGRASGTDEEVLRQVEAGFQSEVGRSGGRDAGADSGAPVEAESG